MDYARNAKNKTEYCKSRAFCISCSVHPFFVIFHHNRSRPRLLRRKLPDLPYHSVFTAEHSAFAPDFVQRRRFVCFFQQAAEKFFQNSAHLYRTILSFFAKNKNQRLNFPFCKSAAARTHESKQISHY